LSEVIRLYRYSIIKKSNNAEQPIKNQEPLSVRVYYELKETAADVNADKPLSSVCTGIFFNQDYYFSF